MCLLRKLKHTTLFAPNRRNPLIYWAFLDRRHTVSTWHEKIESTSNTPLGMRKLIDRHFAISSVCGNISNAANQEYYPFPDWRQLFFLVRSSCCFTDFKVSQAIDPAASLVAQGYSI